MQASVSSIAGLKCDQFIKITKSSEISDERLSRQINSLFSLKSILKCVAKIPALRENLYAARGYRPLSGYYQTFSHVKYAYR
jgi:hypothetical protein